MSNDWELLREGGSLSLRVWAVGPSDEPTHKQKQLYLMGFKKYTKLGKGTWGFGMRADGGGSQYNQNALYDFFKTQ